MAVIVAGVRIPEEVVQKLVANILARKGPFHAFDVEQAARGLLAAQDMRTMGMIRNLSESAIPGRLADRVLQALRKAGKIQREGGAWKVVVAHGQK